MKRQRDKISKEYSKAIASEAKTIVSNTGGAKFADYRPEELKGLPQDIAEHSFGCGNPLAFSDVMEGQSVLDLGCGAGLDLLLAADKVGATGRVIGVDFNEDMLALARKRTNGLPHIELRHGSIENLPVESGSIDWIISNCVINLSDDKQSAFNEIARVLKPRGQMLVSDIVADQLPWWVRRSGVLRAACGGGVISEKQYLAGLRKAGLVRGEIVARQYYAPDQLAPIALGAVPDFVLKLRCCGKQVLSSILTRLAEPISKKLWSVKIHASVLGP